MDSKLYKNSNILFIDSGAGLVLSLRFILAVVLNMQRKQFYSCEANSLGVVWCSYNERTMFKSLTW